MYLTPADVEATLAVIEKRSAAGSRLIVVYHRPSAVLKVIGLFVRRLGEPFRSSFKPEAMRALLAKYRFDVVADAAICDLGGAMSAEIRNATKPVKQLRIATADRAG
jgi:O-methyltransferase involved in polyketide biosynthesis